jgi:hypothetical protein
MYLLGLPLSAPADEWQTEFEKSSGSRTPRYDATIAYCQRLAEATPQLAYSEFGISPQGRGLPLLVVDKHGFFTPAQVRQTDNAILLVEACIHAGECCGKDAGMMLLRDLTVTARYPELLEHVTILFIPIFNVDGHERFGPYNRINQNGPEETGWRVTAQNLNLNRDFLKSDTPEMRAWLKLFTAWRPDFFVDIHSTDGADYQYTITYSMEVHGNMHPAPTAWTKQYIGRVEKLMAAAGYPLSPYVTFKRWHDPRSGLVSWVAPPRLSQGYTALHDVPGLLIEAHMLKPYKERVAGTYEILKQTLVILNQEHRPLRQAIAQAGSQTASEEFQRDPLPLDFELVEESVPIDFLGYEYDVVESEVSGGDWFQYSDRPMVYEVPFFNAQRVSIEAELPEAYIIPPEWEVVIDRLKLHGVAVKRLLEPRTLRVRSYKFWDLSWQDRPYEGRHPVRFQTDELQEERFYPAGSAVIDIRQPAAKVAAHILEPHAPDSYVQWGFFDAILSRVEYFESYVMEKMARKMMADDPDLRREFEELKATDVELAANPRAILTWFYKRTPYYDFKHNVYPVGWIDERGEMEQLPLAD